MSEPWIRALILACTFGAVVLLVELLASTIGRTRSVSHAINERLRLIAGGRSRLEAMTSLRRETWEAAHYVPRFLVPTALSFERMLVAARVRVSALQVLLLLICAPLVVFFVVAVGNFLTGGTLSVGRVVMLLVFSAAAGVALPLLALQMKANRMRRKMQEQFPIALDVFVRGLRAGHPIAAALDLLTVEMPDPIGSEFGIVVDEVTYGADLRDALHAMADRWNMEELRMFVVSLAIQAETGGNLAEILENLARVIRERASMLMKVRALSSEGRMTALMLTVLPVFAFALLFLFNPQFYLDVADDPAFVPAFGFLLILYGIGFIIIRRMIDLKV